LVLIGRVTSLDSREKLRRQWGGRGMRPARWNALLDAAAPPGSKGVVVDAASRRRHARFLAVTSDDDAGGRFSWFSALLPAPVNNEAGAESAPPPTRTLPVCRNPLAPSRRTRFDLHHHGGVPPAPPPVSPPISRLPRAVVGDIALFLDARCAMRLYATNRAAHNDASRDYLPRAPTHLGYEHHSGGIALRVEFAAPT
jgi:hypothetical protein